MKSSRFASPAACISSLRSRPSAATRSSPTAPGSIPYRSPATTGSMSPPKSRTPPTHLLSAVRLSFLLRFHAPAGASNPAVITLLRLIYRSSKRPNPGSLAPVSCSMRHPFRGCVLLSSPFVLAPPKFHQTETATPIVRSGRVRTDPQSAAKYAARSIGKKSGRPLDERAGLFDAALDEFCFHFRLLPRK